MKYLIFAILLAVPSCPNPNPTPTPTPIPTPTPNPDPTPTPPPLTCANLECLPGYICQESPGPVCIKQQTDCGLDTPIFTLVNGARFNIHPSGNGFDVTPFGCFGSDYCAKAGWTDGRSCCAVAVDENPNRIPCEKQFMNVVCPILIMSRCTGVGGQCPLTFNPYYSKDDKTYQFPQNEAANCPWDPQNGTMVRAYKSVVDGKGYFEACTGPGLNGENPICTEYEQEVNH